MILKHPLEEKIVSHEAHSLNKLFTKDQTSFKKNNRIICSLVALYLESKNRFPVSEQSPISFTANKKVIMIWIY